MIFRTSASGASARIGSKVSWNADATGMQVHDLLARRLEALARACEPERVDRLGLDRARDDDREDHGDEGGEGDLVAAGRLEEQEDGRERRVRAGAEERAEPDQRIRAARPGEVGQPPAPRATRNAPPLMAPMKKIGPNTPPGAPQASERLLRDDLGDARAPA